MNVLKVKPSSDASGILDLIRFLSAITVLELHATLRHMIPGYQAVMVFFVLSGYFVGSSVLKNVFQRKWSWSLYLTNRLVRLWIVLIPALLLTYIWVMIQNTYTNETIHHYGLTSFLKNVLFLKGEFVPSFGHNGVLWSLSYEFWYYILFPPLILCLFSKSVSKKLFYVIVTGALALFIYHVLGPRVLKYFSIWIMGAGVALLPQLKLHSKWMRRGLVMLGLAVAIGSLWIPDWLIHYTPTSSVNDEPYSSDVVIGLCYSLLIYLIISFYKASTYFTKLTKMATYFAGFSYTLYLIHFPVFNFIRASHKDHAVPLLQHFHPARNLFDNILLVCLMVGYAWVVSRLTEEHTAKMRRLIKKILFRHPSILNRWGSQTSQTYK